MSNTYDLTQPAYHVNLSKKDLKHLKSWQKQFPDSKVNIYSLPHHSSWDELFEILENAPQTHVINDFLSHLLESDPDVVIYPKPQLLFNAFLLTSAKSIKVVFIGQDPYFQALQAMGLAFSVPYGIPIPSSLQNMFKNGKNNGHIIDDPTHGNLEFWAMQGCLMINTALTVLDGQKNCHSQLWKWFTTRIIKYLSFKFDKLIFVLWGSDAFSKLEYIDQDKHEVIISSHPSGLSAAKGMKGYPAFNDVDQFGEINKILRKWQEREIIWQV